MERQYSAVYWKIYDAVAQRHPRVISNRGGARSTKTVSTLQFLNDVVPHDAPGEVTSVVSETLPHLKKGAIRDFERIIGHPLKFDNRWNESDHCYTYDNGARLEFFSVDSPGKVQGPARKRLFVNEANHINYETYRQLAIRTTGLIFIDYNPTSAFWAMDKVENRDTTVTITSTYKDNPFLSREQVAEIESNRGDVNWWKVYGLGQVGVLEGVIYDVELIDELPEVGGKIETYGLDFGFTHDPSVLDHCLIDNGRREIYVDEVFHRRGMLNADMAAAMQEAGVPRNVPVYADSAEPKTIAELCSYGYTVLPCYKATRKAEQIQAIRGYRLYFTKRSVSSIKEFREYVWAKDKDGKELNEPIAINDHSPDAMRYGVFLPITEGGRRLSLGFGSDYEY